MSRTRCQSALLQIQEQREEWADFPLNSTRLSVSVSSGDVH